MLSIITPILSTLHIHRRFTNHVKKFALRCNLRYRLMVSEKKENGFDSLNAKKRTNRAMRFFYVRLPLFVLNGRRWRGSLRACWYSFLRRSVNPIICRPPRLTAGGGLTAKKETSMPCTITSIVAHLQNPQRFTRPLKKFALRCNLRYRSLVPEKEGKRVLQPDMYKAHRPRKAVFSCVLPLLRLLRAAMVRRLRPAGSLVRRSANPAICCPPRFAAGRGLNVQGTTMSSTVTFTTAHLQITPSLAHQASALFIQTIAANIIGRLQS